MPSGNVNNKQEELKKQGNPVEEKKGNEFTTQSLKLEEIGKPCGFNPAVDPQERVHKYIRSKMSVIDIIPCDWGIEWTNAGKAVQEKSAKGLLPKIDYKENVGKYQELCKLYGLEKGTGVRLYVTDESVATDEVHNSYDDSFFDSIANSASGLLRQFRSIVHGSGSQYKDIVGDSVINPAADKISGLASQLGASGEAAGILGDVARLAGNVILKGNRLSFPKVWSNSEYNPNLNVTIKLVSPYGSPKSIAEFVIRPLMHLLLLSGAKSDDGVSYGYPFPLTIRAYGLNHIVLGVISSLAIRRGGNDTSFNIYHQPLSLDVSLTFSSLVSGFAIISKDELMATESKLSMATVPLQDKTISGGKMPFFTTLGKIVDSLRPIEIDRPLPDDPYYTGNVYNLVNPFGYNASALNLNAGLNLSAPAIGASINGSFNNSQRMSAYMSTTEMVRNQTTMQATDATRIKISASIGI